MSNYMQDWLNIYADSVNKVLTDNKDLLDEKMLNSLLIDKEKLTAQFNTSNQDKNQDKQNNS